MIQFDKLYKAKVIDNDDQNHPTNAGKKNRVKIYIDTFMEGWGDNEYPWAWPFSLSTGCTTSKKSGNSNSPEKNGYVYVFFADDERKKYPFYIADYSIPDTSIAGEYETNTQSSIAGAEITKPESAYPDNKITTYKNGITIGVSSNDNTPEIFYYHPKGTFFFINKDGKVLLKSAANINIEAGSSAIEKAVLGETLKGKLESLCDELTTILSNISTLTVSVPAAPGVSTPPLNAAAFVSSSANVATLKAGLTAILSGLFKHN